MVKKTYNVLPMPITCNWFLTCPYYKIREKGEKKISEMGSICMFFYMFSFHLKHPKMK